MILDHPGPISKLGYNRKSASPCTSKTASSKSGRFRGPDDPAGDDDPSSTLAESMIAAIARSPRVNCKEIIAPRSKVAAT